ncbi:MAG: hypothetical protein AB7L66_00670 [Gemmatimonadales bacterium]
MTIDPRYRADVASVDAIIAASYDVISGPAGPRDWDRERHLFHPAARLMRGLPAGAPRGADPTPGVVVRTVAEFIEVNGPRFLDEAFYEYELGRAVVRFGRWAHATSAYASSRTPNGPAFARGVNSFQLWEDAGRWWIMSILWDWEDDAVRIPPSLAAKP